MLKHAREYIKREFEKKHAKLQKLQKFEEEYEILKAKCDEGKRYSDVFIEVDKAKSNLIGDIIFCFIATIMIGICMIAALHPFTINFYVGMAVLLGCDALKVGKAVLNLKRANKKLEEAESNLTFFNPEEINDIQEFEKTLHRYSETIGLNQLEIAHLTRDLTALWDILSSDDFTEALIRHEKNINVVDQALYQEWLGYIEELKNAPISGIHLSQFSTNKKRYPEGREPIYAEPKKLEKNPNHPLSTY